MLDDSLGHDPVALAAAAGVDDKTLSVPLSSPAMKTGDKPHKCTVCNRLVALVLMNVWATEEGLAETASLQCFAGERFLFSPNFSLLDPLLDPVTSHGTCVCMIPTMAQLARSA